MNARKSNLKLLLIILVIIILLGAAVLYVSAHKNNQAELGEPVDLKIAGVYLPVAQDMIKFQLTDHHGNAFANSNLAGHWTFMFFGFTNCGMVCPTTMASLNSMYRTLERQIPKQQLPQVVMVSVDPERDTQEKMQQYVTTFNKNFIGARAELPQITALEKALHLVAVKMQAGDGKNQYTINHSAEIMVFNPAGKLQAFLSYPHDAQQMAVDYRAILKSQIK